ncbi:MAG: hypothetical protein QM688_12685 [Sphingomonas bacterium]
MSIKSGAFAHYRIGLALVAAAMLGSCGSTPLRLPSCWRASDLKQGLTFRGTVLIFAGYDARPSMFPISCDGGVVADLPEDFTLSAAEGKPFGEPPERHFFQADVSGKVVGVALGRPSVQLGRIAHVKRTTPSWFRPNGR